jgi:outer membrane protein OmpA-like peptidoglycan-associated protein
MKWKYVFVLICLTQQLAAQNFTIYFESAKAVIPDSMIVPIAQFIFTNKPDSVHIIGHCDSIGSDAYNITLSKKRAAEVKLFCVANTINEKAITILIGKGERAPAAANATEEGRQLNRRVELYFYKAKQPIPNTANVIPIKVSPTPKPIAKSDTIKSEPVKKQVSSTTPGLLTKKPIMLKKNEKFILPAIRFYPAQHIFMEESEDELRELLGLLKANPTLRIKIIGHVCCTLFPGQDGDDAALGTSNLSVTRALAIRNFLVANGVAKSRLEYEGRKGAEKLFPEERNPQEKEANRRVEFLILDI